MAIKAVFAISHPMQYLHALEARHARGLRKDECAVLMFNKPYAEQKRQLAAVVDEADWAVVRSIPYPGYWVPPGMGRTVFARCRVCWSKLVSAPGFARAVDDFLSHECGPLELVATGFYLSRPHRHFLAVAERKYGAKEIMLLDEGISTPIFAALRRGHDAAGTKRFKNRFGSKDIAGKLLRLLAGMRFHHPESVTFFTMYGDIEAPVTDNVEVNAFTRLRAQAAGFKNSDEVWFIGTCCVEHKFVAADRYRTLLGQVRADFGQKTILYLPHRYEASENLEKIATLGFRVTSPGMAVEPWLISRKVLPSRIVAIATSAIDSISHMFGGGIPVTLYKPSEGFCVSRGYDEIFNNAIDDHVKNGHGAVEVIEMDFKPGRCLSSSVPGRA